MMTILPDETWLLLTVAAPLVGAFLLPLFGRISENLRNWSALLLVLISLVGAFSLIPAVYAGQRPVSGCGDLVFLQADGLAVFMAIVSSLVGAIIVFYSFGYISHYGWRNEYYFMVVLFLGAMMGLVFSRHLIAMYLFWEITAIVCWRLIGFFRDPDCVLKADKAFLVTVFGAVMMLLGFIMIYTETGTFDLEAAKAALSGRTLSHAAVLFILLGIFAKSATAPLHTWLPDAGVAPSPVTALLHAAVLVKIGVYAYARLFVATFAVPAEWHVWVPQIAAASALISAGAALIEKDIKRIIAFSTVSQIAFIFLGLSVGNPLGVAGGILYLLMHGIAKGGLFLCAGIVEQRTHERDITRLGGLLATMPATAVCFLLCAFSVMGIPPLGGFFSKYMVIASAFGQGQKWLGFTFVAGAVLTVLYLFRVFALVFLGEPGIAVRDKNPREGPVGMVGSVILLAVLAVATGLCIHWPAEFVRAAVAQMGHMR